MKKYLDNTFFTFEGVTDERFYSYSTTDKVKGRVDIEVSIDQDSAEVIHTDLQSNTFSYEVFNQKELQDTIEFILGKKVVSEDQWKQNTALSCIDDVEEWDDDIIR
jgi:5-methylcytosine-specific restriction endonuclease McrBC regulatory subunit McrC